MNGNVKKRQKKTPPKKLTELFKSQLRKKTAESVYNCCLWGADPRKEQLKTEERVLA